MSAVKRQRVVFGDRSRQFTRQVEEGVAVSQFVQRQFADHEGIDPPAGQQTGQYFVSDTQMVDQSRGINQDHGVAGRRSGGGSKSGFCHKAGRVDEPPPAQ